MGVFKVTYAANNTFTVPAGVTEITVECEGGAGAGGGGGTVAAGGGGGGGAYAASTLTVTPGSTHSVVVGQQTASTPGNTVGANGNLSSFGTGPLVRAAAGLGGGKPTGIGGITAGAAGAGGSVANSIGTTKTAGSNGSGRTGGAGAPPLGGPQSDTTNYNGRPYGGAGEGGAAISSGGGGYGAEGVVIVTFTYTDDAITSNDNIQLVVNFNREFNESVIATDDIAKLVLKPYSEQATVTDDYSGKVTKSYSESTVASDAVASAVALLRQESIITSDSINKVMSLLKTDLAIITDEYSKTVQKSEPELIISSDTISSILEKPVQENLSISDFPFIVLVYLRYYNDIATAVDVISKTLNKSHADSVATIDSTMKLTLKKFSDDFVTVTDSAFVQSIYSRLAEDTAITTDILAKTLGISFTDSISGSVAVAPSGRKIFIISD